MLSTGYAVIGKRKREALLQERFRFYGHFEELRTLPLVLFIFLVTGWDERDVRLLRPIGIGPGGAVHDRSSVSVGQSCNISDDSVCVCLVIGDTLCLTTL